MPIGLVLVLSLLTESFSFHLTVFGAILAGLVSTRVGARLILRAMQPLVLLVLVTVVYHLAFSGGESTIVFELAGIRIRELALEKAAFYSLRLGVFVSVAYLVTLTNSPSDLADAFTKLALPLRHLRVPVYDLALILFIAIRFIPILFEEFVAIRNAQVVRGVSFEGSWGQRIRRSSSLLIPVFVAAIQRADDLAEALEVRGYGRSEERTFYSRTRFGSTEIGFSVMACAALIVLFRVTSR